MSIRNIVNTIERKVIAAKNHSVGKEKAEMVEKLTHCDGPMMLRKSGQEISPTHGGQSRFHKCKTRRDCGSARS